MCSKQHSPIFILPLLLMVLDYAAVVCAEYMALLTRQIPWFHARHFVLNDTVFWFIIPFLFFVTFQLKGLYKRKTQFWQMIGSLVGGCSYAVLVGLVFLYVGHISESSSRLFVGFLWLWSMALVVLFRYVGCKLLSISHVLQLPAIIIGGGSKASLLAQAISHDAGLGYHILGWIGDSQCEGRFLLQNYPCLGVIDDVETILSKRHAIVMVATEGLELEKFKELVFRIQALTRHVCIVPDFTGIPMGDLHVESFYMEKLLMLEMGNNLANPLNLWVKNVCEYIVALVGALCLLPVFVVISVLIYLDDPGPAIYVHQRVGKGGKLFPCYKFRSMVVNSQQVLADLLAHDPASVVEWEHTYKLKDDPRITRFGAFLRRTSLDELPQLFNVLKGEMSLVGPRPVLQQELDKYYKGYASDYLSVKPGITGMWQVSGRSDLDYKERVELDRWYVRNWSIWIDIMLLWRTVKVVFLGRGAY